jgi:hypothetical protein
MYKKIVPAIYFFSSFTVIASSAHAEKLPDLIQGRQLSKEACSNPANTRVCLSIGETANLIGTIYKGKEDSDADLQANIQRSMSQPGIGWDRGYQKDKVEFISRKESMSFTDVQFVLARKTVAGKHQFLINIRGSQQPGDFVEDAAALVLTDYGGTKVGLGFLNHAKAIAKHPKFEAFLEEIIRAEVAGEPYEVMITGHSLGGAAATIIKAKLEDRMRAENRPNAVKNIFAITFGAPPVGDKRFAATYGERVIGIVIAGDPVPSAGWKTERVGEIYQFQRPDDMANFLQSQARYTIPLGWQGTLYTALGIKAGDAIKGIGDHINGYGESGNYLNQYLSSMTQNSSSPIGSAASFFGVDRSYIAADNPTQQYVNQGRGQSIQEKNTYTNGVIVQAPIDIGLTWNQTLSWNQSTDIDLDSHLVTPNRDHIYYPTSSRGSLNNAPNAFLYRDSIPSALRGAEQTRIDRFQQGEYQFYVNNFSCTPICPDRVGGDTSLSSSGARVGVFEGGRPLVSDQPNSPANFDPSNPALQNTGNPYPGQSTFNVPTNQVGNTWHVFTLDTRTGVLYKVNQFGNVNSASEVPGFRPSR